MIRIEGPAVQLVTADELLEHARVDGGNEYQLAQAYIDAAIGWVDGFDGVLGRCVMPQTWRASAEEVACGWKPADVVSEMVNADGTVDFTCAMPIEKVATVKQAVLLLAAYWFDQRMAATEQRFEDAPMAVRSLLSSVRVWV